MEAKLEKKKAREVEEHLRKVQKLKDLEVEEERRKKAEEDDVCRTLEHVLITSDLLSNKI